MRRLIWLCLTAGCLLGCLLTPNTVFAAMLSCCVGVPVISWGLLWLARGKIGLNMEAPSVVEKGSVLPLKLRTLSGKIPTGPVSVLLTAQNTVTGERVKRRVTLTGERAMNLDCPYCGCVECRLERGMVWDWFGLLPVPLRDCVTKRILVTPHTFPVEISMESVPAWLEDCQEYAQDRRGQDRTEVYQIRDYVPGDSLGQIHWKLSGKKGSLLVREPACPIEQSLMVFVDRAWGDIPPEGADALMEAAVSIGQALCEQGVPFRLCWNGETIESIDVTRENLPEAVSALLKSRTMDGISGDRLYLHICGAPSAGQIIYLGTQSPAEAFCRGALCKALLLGQDGFTPETAAEALRNLSWS